MHSRDEYITAYDNHYKLMGKEGAGVGLGGKIDLLLKGGYKDGMSLLDYGCGWGALLTGLPSSVDYVGVDISRTAIKLARKEFPLNNFQVLEIGRLDVKPKQFAVAFSVFTHALKSDVQDCLLDIHNSLTDDGIGLVDIMPGDSAGDIHFRYWVPELFEKELVKAGFDYEFLFTQDSRYGFHHSYYRLKKHE